ncbi:MAG TPA: right-handed parallel beta-helix repeat-containing protein [Pyrinomonadaceae bacterium]|nr:right-handed parallel beta-helix repeat-containing protein [Pyrinomonadaceae bacterium]
MFSPTPRRPRSRPRAAVALALVALLNLIPLQPLAASRLGGPQEKSGAPSVEQTEGRSPLAKAPVLGEFREWVEQFKLGGTTAASEQRGLELARRRRAVMTRLVEEDPRSAVEQAVPGHARDGMPKSVRQEVEEEVSGYGDYVVLVYDEADPQTGEFTKSRTERKVLLAGKTYRASVYGRKLGMTTKLNIPLRGFVVGDVITLAESPVRVLGEGERADPAAGGQGIEAEVGGKVMRFESRERLDDFERKLAGQETSIGPGGAGAAGGEDATAAQAPSEHPSAAASTSPWTAGPKKVLLMRVDFSDKPGEPVETGSNAVLTLARAQALINTDCNNFFKNNSYNNTSLQGTVTPVLRLPQTAAWYGASNNAGQLLTDARAAAKAKGYNTDNFDLDIVAFTRISNFSWAGLAYLGWKGTWLNGYFGLREAGHELGHNYGLNHANLWKTSNGTVNGTGSSTEYGDPFDTMGASGDSTGTKHFNAWFKNLLGWLPDADVQTVTGNGTYQIRAYDSIVSTGRRALKIQKDTSTFYWVEFRQAMLNDAFVPNGAVVHWGYLANKQSNLLDMTPTSAAGAADAPLAIGQTFTDAQSGFSLTAVRKVGTSPETLELRVNFTKPPLLSVSLTPNTVVGGKTAVGVVTVGAPAPSGGITVTLGDNLTAAATPASVVIPAGSKSKTFSVTTQAGMASQYGLVTATYNGVSKAGVLNVVRTPALASLSLSPGSVAGGNVVTGTVTLTEAAPSTGVTVNLSDGLASTTVPPTVVVPADALSATFSIQTAAVGAAQNGVVSAVLNGAAKTAPLTVRPVNVASVSVSPGLVVGGNNAVGTVVLDRKVNAITPVTLSDDLNQATLPAKVNVPAGSDTATFTVTTSTVAANLSGSVTATLNGVSRSGPLKLTPNRLEVLNRNDGGAGSYRQALLDANARPGKDLIVFKIPGTGVRIINVASQLPTLTGPVIIDATTQPGYLGKPIVELNGAPAGASSSSNGVHLTGGDSSVRGLTINRFGGNGIRIENLGGNVVEGNYIGVNYAASAALGNAYAGIWIINAPNNVIGGATAGARNVISGNKWTGVIMSSTAGNVVQGNFIGTNAAGTAAVPNGNHGIHVEYGPDNRIGGPAAGARNVISGNAWSGVSIYGIGAARNIVQGNFIGTNAAGTAALSNGNHGVNVVNASIGNLIGGGAAGERNVVSGNKWNGINVSGGAGTRVAGNLVGTNAAGTAALGNSMVGVSINNSILCVVGGATAGERNVISGNLWEGVRVTGNLEPGNVVQGNYIGTDAAGASSVPNGGSGIYVYNAARTRVGGTGPGSGNVVAFNGNGVPAIYVYLTGVSTGTHVNWNRVRGTISVTVLGNGSGATIFYNSAWPGTVGTIYVRPALNITGFSIAENTGFTLDTQ